MTQQQQYSKEELENMSPEQIVELQKKNCIFCHIREGKIPSKKIYEDDKCFAILDINPATKGHILLIPNEHYAIMPQIPPTIINHLFIVAKKLSLSMLKGMQADGTNIFIANGPAAGQRAQHFMVHIIPRKEGEEITAFDLAQNPLDDSVREKLVKHLRPAMKKIPGNKIFIVNETAKRDEEQKRPKASETQNQEKQGAKSDIDLDAISKMFSK